MAGIVTYNPDISNLKDNIESIRNNVTSLIISDNGSENYNEIVYLIDIFNDQCGCKIKIIKNNNNIGIAAALNQIMDCGIKNDYKWVITLDQDSIAPINIIESNFDLLKADGVAIISPVIHDRNITHKKQQIPTTKYSELDICITSASITSTIIWEEIGRFDEKMFIDYVDWEYCLRAKKFGYKIIRNNQVFLSHEIGQIREVKFFGKWISIKNHSAFRKYYQIRNLFYFDRKIYGHFTPKSFVMICISFVKVLLYENNKFSKLSRMMYGLLDGIKIKV